MLETNSSLKSEAEEIIRELELLELLGQYGVARIVGSVALDLIVKLDIDFHVVIQSPDLLHMADSVYHQLLEREHVHEVRISDYRDQGGVKVGVDAYPGPSGNWSIDIWITDRVETGGFALADRLNRELHSEHREAILRIKREYHQRGKLRDGLSALIYVAVLDSDVRTKEGFRRFLVERGQSIRG